MKKNKAGNNSFLKEFNQATILDLVRAHRSISKADLAKKTGLSPTAIGLITTSLIEKGYIYEAGTGESKGGRKPVLLELKPDSYYSIGIDIDIDKINLVIMDITCKLIYERSLSTPINYDYKEVVEIIEKLTTEAMNSKNIVFDKLLGIGVSVPSIVDSQTKELVLAPNLHWHHKKIKSDIKIFTGVPVFLENEAMASAICENWMGACVEDDNFVCINVGNGIGAGIFTHGRPYRGCGGSAGELGHIVVDENGPKCGCENYGCLETLASTKSIVENMKRKLKQGTAASICNDDQIENVDINCIVRSAKEGNEEAKAILLESARYLGIAISSIVNTLNPSKIVIGKEFTCYSDIVIEYLRGVVSRKALKHPASRVQIVASDLGKKTSAIGAAIIPIKTIFGRS